MQVKERVRDFFCGILIGCANIIPGVSGGTVAVSTGVFDRAILALNGLIGDRGNRKTHLLTLLPLLVGVLAGLLLFSKLVSYLLDVAPLPTFAAFLGMVVGSLPMLGRNALKKGFRPLSVVWFLIAAGIVLAMEFLESGASQSGPYTFFSGVILLLAMTVSSASMVMPGLSGSFIMLLFGLYETAVDAVANLEWLKILPMALGAVLGVALISKLMAWLLKKHYAGTYAAIMGFVCGSLAVLVLRMTAYLPVPAWQIVVACATLAGGVLLTLATQRSEP